MAFFIKRAKNVGKHFKNTKIIFKKSFEIKNNLIDFKIDCNIDYFNYTC